MNNKKNFLTKDANFLRLSVVFIIVFVLCCILQGRNFLNLGNFQSMMIQFPEYGLLAVAISAAAYRRNLCSG